MKRRTFLALAASTLASGCLRTDDTKHLISIFNNRETTHEVIFEYRFNDTADYTSESVTLPAGEYWEPTELTTQGVLDFRFIVDGVLAMDDQHAIPTTSATEVSSTRLSLEPNNRVTVEVIS